MAAKDGTRLGKNEAELGLKSKTGFKYFASVISMDRVYNLMGLIGSSKMFLNKGMGSILVNPLKSYMINDTFHVPLIIFRYVARSVNPGKELSRVRFPVGTNALSL